MAVYKTPGVFIEELPATGPIQGVGTSTAAFLGPAQRGSISIPTKITNWTQFRTGFGEYMPNLYLAYAVRGFFENGGTVAYIVRVGNAVKAWAELDDRPVAGKSVRVQAKVEGPDGNTITATVSDAQIVAPANNARVRRARAAITGGANNVVTLANLADAALFRPGDVLIIEGVGQRLTLERIRQNELFVQPNLAAAAAAGHVRIADLAIGQTVFRVQNPAGIEPGSVLNLAQAAAPNQTEDVVVNGVAGEFVTIAGPGLTQAYGMATADPIINVTSYEFTLVITKVGSPTETFPRLAMDNRHSRYFVRVVTSALVEVSPPGVPSVQPPPANRPAVAATLLANGANDNLAAIGLVHYQNALQALEKTDDVNLVCVPDRTDAGAQGAVIAHCEKTADRFAVLDAARGAPLFGAGSVIGQRAAVESARGYGALYYPWILINDPNSATGDDTILVPPSGHLAGIYARSDTQRGVHKAPANELIRGAIGLERIVDDAEQGELNVENVNVLRIFPGKARPVVWGARTTAPPAETAWRYINVRRLFEFVEESIQEGIAWAVFEPNDTALWKKLKRVISEFLERVWRSGALFGDTAAQAFYVKIDEELNPASVRDLGQIIIEIGIAPVRPAEFVIVRIGMWEGGSEVTEG